jgi:hypothetical protein
MKKTWTKTLGSIALAMAALAGGTVPADAQIMPKQPMASGAAAPALPMRKISNAQRKMAADQLAAKRTAARARKTAAPSIPVNQNSRNGSDQR